MSFDNEGNILFETNFGRSYVIISDTSGFWMDGEYLYLNYNKSIYKVNSDNGEIEWATNVNGISARHLPVVCGNLLFYTTLSGEIGCLNKKNGTLVWTVSTQERSIVAPPTIYNGTLLVLADCSLYLIDKMNGSFYSKKAIGHSPYSAITIFNNSVFVGCGAPPVNGLLTSYEITEDNISQEYFKDHFEVGNYVESDKMQIIVNIENDKLKNIKLDASVISSQGYIESKNIENKLHIFEFKLKNNNLSGYYALPISYEIDEVIKTEIICIYLFKTEKLPSKYRLNKFFKEIKQSHEFNSGSAISQAIFKEYKKEISQDEFRKIINYLKQNSNWKDADFQTWRLILKRALSSSAKTLDEFIKNENEVIK